MQNSSTDKECRGLDQVDSRNDCSATCYYSICFKLNTLQDDRFNCYKCIFPAGTLLYLLAFNEKI